LFVGRKTAGTIHLAKLDLRLTFTLLASERCNAKRIGVTASSPRR
jgi:hypothetical protein